MLNFIPIPKPIMVGLISCGAAIGTYFGGPVDGLFMAMSTIGIAVITNSIIDVIHKIKGVEDPNTAVDTDVRALEVMLASIGGFLATEKLLGPNSPADFPADTVKLLTGFVGIYFTVKDLAGFEQEIKRTQDIQDSTRKKISLQ